MNLEEYWQENRRFVLGLAGGLVLFLIGLYVADAVYGTELRSARAQEAKIKRDLAQPMFTRAQLAEAEEDRERLRAAVDTLASTVAFAEREEFRLREGLGSASAQYHEIVGRLRDAGISAELDVRSDTLNYRIRDGELNKIPYLLVVGGREVEAGTVAVRARGAEKKQEVVLVQEFVDSVVEEVRTRALVP